ncbi:hypothetical protein [Agromyces sp. NPDC056965]|uniref:hypothetical protein n=1 Tax=Agromyces sp. NPDC056965 TaxID=3345983 RepID=UPI00363019D6
MEWIAMSIAVVAAIFTGWQAWEARKSRVEARRSASDAQDHEERAVEASERIAAAIEEQNSRERAAAEKYATPFAIGEEYVQGIGAKRWKLALGGTEVVHGVSVEIDPPDTMFSMRPDPVPSELHPGAVVLFDWWRGGNAPDFIAVTVRWTRPNGNEHQARKELH